MSSPSVSDYYLYAVTFGVAYGGVADTVNILCLSVSSFFFSFLPNCIFLPEVTVCG